MAGIGDGTPAPGRDLLLLTLLAAALLVPFAGARDLFDTDEGRFGAIAWTMVQEGDWVTPRVNDMPFVDKPPLVYWVQAVVMRRTGPTELAARAPNLLAGIVWVLVVFLFTRDWTGSRKQAWTAALVAATGAAGMLGSRFGPHLDMPLAACIAVVLYAAWRGIQRSSFGSALALGLGVGCGLLAKGPLSVAVPLAVAVGWGVAGVSPARLTRVIFSPTAWVVALLVAAPWYVLVERAHPGTFAHFVGHEHLSRFGRGDFRQFHPFWYYVPVAVLYLVPWTPLAWRAGSRGGVHRAADLALGSPWFPRPWQRVLTGTSPVGRGGRGVPVARLAWTAFLAVFLLFSISRQKLFPYLLTGAFPLFVLAGVRLDELLSTKRRVPYVLPLLMAIATIVAGILVQLGILTPGARVPLGPTVDVPRWAPLAPALIAIGLVLLLATIGAWRLARHGGTRLVLLAVGITLFWWGMDVGLGRVGDLGSSRAVAAALAEATAEGRVPITLNRYPQGIRFYEEDLVVWIAGGSPDRWRQREIANPFGKKEWQARVARQADLPEPKPVWEGSGGLLTDDEFWHLWRSDVPLAVVCRFKEIAILEAHVLAGPFGGAGRTDLFVVTNVAP